MATFTPVSSSLMDSPKRKRGSDPTTSSPQTMKPLLPRLAIESDQQALLEQNDTGSPRSLVAGNLEQLDLSGPCVQRLSFKDAGRARKRFAQMSPEPRLEAPDETPPLSPPGATSASSESIMTSHPTTPSDLEQGNDFWAQDVTPKFSKPQARSVSPPLDGDPEDNPLTWHESEITGHDPKDPDDDGYGINGIGFKPTAAIRWSRSQKRKQQIAEYRSREAREARQRRSERRHNEHEGNVEQSEEEHNRRISKVRFDEAFIEEIES